MNDTAHPPSACSDSELLSPYEMRLRELATERAQYLGVEPTAVLLDMKKFMDSDAVLEHRLHEAVRYLSWTPREEITYERFWEILTHRHLT